MYKQTREGDLGILGSPQAALLIPAIIMQHTAGDYQAELTNEGP